jgi:outer membrane receptor protein involved in Fe transport
MIVISRQLILLCACFTVAVNFSSAAEDVSAVQTGQLQEIVVTAQKREERLQDVPVPVSVIDAQSLLDQGQERIQDYYASVPGLNLTTDSRGSAQIAIRGITTGVGGGNPTVAVTLDDVPYGSSSTYGGSIQPIPDLDPSEIARVEILRGPQGTLYGASSIGGLVKYVTVDPSTSGLTGHVQADVNGVQNGDGAGYGVRGAVNVPVGDALAFRGSAFVRHDPGFVDNEVSGVRGINTGNAFGVHLATLWKISEEFSLKLGALFQDSRGDGSPNADPGLGLNRLRQTNIPGSGHFDITTQAYTATLTGSVGPVAITSVTGYSVFGLKENGDYSPVLGVYSELGYGVSGAVLTQDVRTNKFSQEVRATVSLSDKLEWLVGAFYTHEGSNVNQDWYAAEPTSGDILGYTLLGSWPTTFQEYAAFTDFTAHLSDKLQMQVGVREGKNKQTYSEVDHFNIGGGPFDIFSPEVTTEDNSFTYLATLQYTFVRDLMAYARLSSGYRPGGPNQDCAAFNEPCHFGPDKTQNYELGVKGDLYDRRLSFDASVYHINWKDIQLQLILPGGAFYVNGGRAKSDGVELAVQSKPFTGTTIGATTAWNRAVLTESLLPDTTLIGNDGDRLPNSARWSGNLSLDQEFPALAGTRGFVGGAISYVGDRLSVFMPAPGTREQFPGYAQINMRGGVRSDGWNLTVYGNNVLDKRGVLSGGLGAFFPGYIYIQPRTVGLSVSRSF